MLELFRRNHFLNSLLLLPYSFLMGIDSFFVPTQLAYPVNSPIYETIFGKISSQPLWNTLLAIFLIFFEAVMINRLVIQHRMGRQTSLLSGVVYIVLINMLPGVRGIHDILIANFFMLFMLSNGYHLMRLYKTEKLLFNMGFWACLSAVFFPGFVVLIPFMFVVLFILRTINVKEMLQMLFGVVNVFLLVIGLSYIFHFPAGYDSLKVIPYFRNIAGLFSFHQFPLSLFLGMTYALVILLVFNFYNLLAKQDFKSQKKIRLTYYLLALTGLGVFFIKNISPHHVLMATVPLSILLGIMLANWKQKLLAELIHLLVITGVLYLHFQTVL